MSDDYDVLRDFMVDAVDDGASVEGAERAKAALLALQGRAEKAEAALHAIFDDAGSGVDLDIGYIDIGLSGQQMKTIRTARPTQETDEPDCTRCGNERTVGGYGTDERFPCPVCRPTQETEELARGIVHDFGEALETLAKHDTFNRPTQETDPR